MQTRGFMKLNEKYPIHKQLKDFHTMYKNKL